MKLPPPLLYLVFLSIGVGVGYLLPFGKNRAEETLNLQESPLSNIRKNPPTTSHTRAERRSTTAHDGGLVTSNSDWENREKNHDSVTIPTSLLQELAAPAGSTGLQQSIFNRNDLTQQLLKITDTEKGAIQREWDEVREQIREIEVAGAQIEALENGGARIDLPENNESTQELAENFHSRLRQHLGENRGKAFAAIKNTTQRISSASQKRSYTIHFEPIPNERWRYRINYEINDERKVWVSETMPDELRHLTDNLQIPASANEEAPEESEEDE